MPKRGCENLPKLDEAMLYEKQTLVRPSNHGRWLIRAPYRNFFALEISSEICDLTMIEMIYVEI